MKLGAWLKYYKVIPIITINMYLYEYKVWMGCELFLPQKEVPIIKVLEKSGRCIDKTVMSVNAIQPLFLSHLIFQLIY